MAYTGSYTLPEQIHCLNFMSNAGFGIISSSFSTLQADVTKLITAVLANDTVLPGTTASVQSLIGTDWQLLWGPYVYSESADNANVLADNTMMMLYSPSQSIIVIAIAGTNMDATYDWMQEDFQVSTTVAWTSVVGGNNGISGDPCISAGSDLGLTNLLNLPSPNGTGATMLSALGTFLGQSTTPSGLQLAVSGHSLGGALSPTMAAYLKDIQNNGNTWNATGKVTTISAWPTAGPTPGDLDFAAHLTTSFLGNYNSYYNNIDAIPHAWQVNTLIKIPGLYSPNLPANDTVSALVAELELKAAKSGHFYAQASPWNSMTSTFNQTTDNNCVTEINNLIAKYPQYTTEITDAEPLLRFMGQVAYQHTVAYSGLLGITDYSLAYAAIKKQVFPNSPTIMESIMEALVRIIWNYIKSKIPAAQTS